MHPDTLTWLSLPGQVDLRYAAKLLPTFPKCGLVGKPYQPFQCISLLTMRDIKFFYDSFHETSEKIIQDNFILKHCSVTDPKRSRKRQQEKNKPKSMSVKYYVKRRDGLMVNVCRQSFMNILGVKKDRILNVVKRYKESNEMRKERRGDKRYFFTRKYNVGFGTPKTDMCSTCLQFQDQIKKSLDINTKNRLMAQQRAHKIRAKCFYELLKEVHADNEVVTFSFDCQKNLALPKIADQAAYFNRLFGQIEKVIKKSPEITSPEQYMKVIEKWGSIYKLGVNVPVQDWKSKVQIVMKPTSQWHFKLQVSKRIIILKTETAYAVGGESFYKNDMGTNQSLLRRGRKLDIKPSTVDIGMPLKSDKKKSISNLIAKHYGKGSNPRTLDLSQNKSSPSDNDGITLVINNLQQEYFKAQEALKENVGPDLGNADFVTEIIDNTGDLSALIDLDCLNNATIIEAQER
ncbi:unnamed protein product [Acanthoscelides obtectus]|uniref:Uncharacterized protein n=1 Tax=Acanthoscelides obtectus TaxID=200917 RepID=A0A9P0LZT7_ACAOB|nr:unnamed protein product [Acanthoscelides obtectus]CAK1637885.1 hypothetical protein AOBTE_LOCUS10260 [Acanthoscelides obtectus]